MVKQILNSDAKQRGFTLIEIVIVVALLAVLSLAAIPALTGFFSTKSENFKIFTGILARTYDDAFLRDRINYLVIHIDGSDFGFPEESTDIFKRTNGLSVLNYIDGQFVDNPRRTLNHRKFSDNFRIESVVVGKGEPVRSGNVLIPYYPTGHSDNVIIHIITDSTDRWSVKIDKHLKEPEVIEGFISHENLF